MASPSVPEALHSLRARASASTASLRELKAQALAQLKDQQQIAPAGHTPSGPRRKGEGVHDEQGILAAEATPSGGARLRITLLAAGFVLGPSGSSVREVIASTGADIRSWSEAWHEQGAGSGAAARSGTKIRTFVVEGKRRAVVQAISIISAAVDRYNELCGGAFSGQTVDRAQVIDGVTFFYSPPPRAAVPYAAALRSHDRSSSPPARKALGFASPPSNKENALGAAASAGAAQALNAGAVAPSTHQLHFHQHPTALHVLGALPATPAAAAQAATAGVDMFVPLSRMGSGLLPALPEALRPVGPEPMALDLGCMGVEGAGEEVEASTPAYRTYSLFGGGVAGMASGGSSLFVQDGPFGSSSSLFASAFEAGTPTPTGAFGATSSAPAAGRSLFGGPDAALVPPAAPAGFLAAATPALMPLGVPLQRQLSMGGPDEALPAAPGFPSYSSFAQQSAFFRPASLLGTPAASSATPTATLQQPSSLLAAGPLAHLPVGVAAAGASGWWQAPIWQHDQQLPQQQQFL